MKSRLKDSIISRQQERIVNDSIYTEKMRVNFESRIEAFREMNLRQIEINSHRDQIINLKNQELRKFRRERKIMGIGILGLIVLTIL